MKIAHFDGVRLEHIVCDVCGCMRGDMGGIVNSDRFERSPLYAAIICVSRLYCSENASHNTLVDKFWDLWISVFEYPDEDWCKEYTMDQYIEALEKLIKDLRR